MNLYNYCTLWFLSSRHAATIRLVITSFFLFFNCPVGHLPETSRFRSVKTRQLWVLAKAERKLQWNPRLTTTFLCPEIIERPVISLVLLVNPTTPLLRPHFLGPKVVVLTGFHCTYICFSAKYHVTHILWSPSSLSNNMNVKLMYRLCVLYFGEKRAVERLIETRQIDIVVRVSGRRKYWWRNIWGCFKLVCLFFLFFCCCCCCCFFLEGVQSPKSIWL